MIQPVRLFNPSGLDRVAVVSVEPSTGLSEGYLLRLARGRGSSSLNGGNVYGPYLEQEIGTHFDALVEELRREGFVPAGLPAQLERLEHESVRQRALGAGRLGWRRAVEAVEPLLRCLPDAVDEVCSLLDALGQIGDARAIPAVRPYAQRKLLSRRRSAVEALRNLGDTEGLAMAQQRALERLPEPIRQLLEGSDGLASAPNPAPGTAELVQQVEQVGLVMDTLYELGTPQSEAMAALCLGGCSFEQPGVWRYVKSIFKRARLRHDARMFGFLAHAIERQGRTSLGQEASIKSGYDGSQKQVRIFGRKTQTYLRRQTWGYLTDLAQYRPEAYAQAAAEVLIHYTPEDEALPSKLATRFAGCYALHQILFGSSQRFRFDSRRLRFRLLTAKKAKPPAGVREESYPQLWDTQPGAYLLLLSAAKLPFVHEFALRALDERHPELLHQASEAEVIGMLAAPHEPTVARGLEELDRRFDPESPNFALMRQLIYGPREVARQLVIRWLRLTHTCWTREVEQALDWVQTPHGDVREVVSELLARALAQSPELREALAPPLRAVLDQPGLEEGAAIGLAELGQRSLTEELNRALTPGDLLRWAEQGLPAVQGLAGWLLGQRAHVIEELGLDAVVNLAEHPVFMVRQGAQQLLKGVVDRFVAHPLVLLRLAESEWPDTRRLAFELLRAVVAQGKLDLDALISLIDSTRVDVQDVAIELMRKRLPTLPMVEVLGRISEHPHANLRRFTLELATRHLPAGAGPLRMLGRLFLSTFLDLSPDRGLMEAVLTFLEQRGLASQEEGEVAAQVLFEVARMDHKGLAPRALQLLTRLKLSFPAMRSPLVLRVEIEA